MALMPVCVRLIVRSCSFFVVHGSFLFLVLRAEGEA